MPHPLPADLGLDDFHPALLTDNASMFHPFVFAAIAFIIFGGSKDLGTEEPVLLRCRVIIIETTKNIGPTIMNQKIERDI
jgi:hypothetical protein